MTREHVLRDEMIDRLADAIVELQKRENTIIPYLQKQLDDIEKRIGNLLDAIEQGLVNASAKERLDGLENKKADIEIALAKEKIEQTPLTKQQIVFWIGKFKDGDIDNPTYRQTLVDAFVNAVFLYDDKLVLTLNWKDGTKTISLPEIESITEAEKGNETPTSAGAVEFLFRRYASIY
jgi:exosome complex RNA-binding protein Rrp42 (RNase PH superfamily)